MHKRNALIALIMTACLMSMPAAMADSNDDIPTNATNTGVHDSLVAALAQAGLVATLQGDGPFTVFAPTDQAFTDAGIDLTAFDTDEENATLVDILLYHVYAGAVYAADVTDGMTVAMVNGDDASFTVTNGTVMIGDATVTSADVMASNGVIHVIDKVLMPPADLVDIAAVAMSTGVHDSLVAALVKADMVGNLQTPGPFTVFAPTDQAFADAGIDLDSFNTTDQIGVLTDILLYHVYAGAVYAADVTDGMTVAMVNTDDASFTVTNGTVMIGDATVTSADVMASNGVIHVIDKVLIPPADLVDIAAVAMSTGAHDSLVAALAKASLVTTVQGDGPFTVFAPTDQAFADAGIDLDAFTTEEQIATLTDILLYHVYAGAVYAADVTDGMTVAMVNGDDASFTVADGNVMIGDAMVTAADVMASNGVIHVINKVLMPPADIPTIPDGCDYVIGLTEDGMAFDNTDLSIDVGQTVCWIWNDAAMAHNVAEIREEGDTSRDAAGYYSGTPVTSIDYRITFNNDETFYYICEPHASMEMNGKVVVGTGISETPTTVVESDDNTPGFTAGIAAIALISALVVAGSRRR